MMFGSVVLVLACIVSVGVGEVSTCFIIGA